MEIKFYNSLTNKIEIFHPLEEGKVSLYVCGPTVYNDPHIGNMRPVIVFDTLRRFLSYVGYDVTYVSNFTDVDDRIIKEAKQRNITEKELTELYINEFIKVTKSIGSLPPTITPKVTEYIDNIISYIDNLVKLDAAYIIDGDVYFRVSKIKDYGSLSGIKIEDLIQGARVDTNSKKESPLDFALWKTTSEGIRWPSPWGEGRPGWHSECCVMIDTIFPKHKIDIHGGGYDLKFPHHENEIAQAEATHNNKIASYWLHNGFINFGNEKMSKSLGNVILAKDIIAKVSGPVVRLAILKTNYRLPVNLTDEVISSATIEINKYKTAYRQASLKLQLEGIDLNNHELNTIRIDNFLASLADDLNTPNALMEMNEEIKTLNQLIRTKDIDFAKLLVSFNTVKDMFSVLGLDIRYVTLSSDDKKLYNRYLELKANKQFEESDILRNQLSEKEII